MIEGTRSDAEVVAGELVIEREFDAPRELVYQAWTDPEHMKQWWGPAGFTVPVCTIDLRPEGELHFCMRSESGDEIWCKGIYREIVEPERIVATTFFSDEEGNFVPPAQLGFGDEWPDTFETIVTFEDLAGRTKLTLQQVGLEITSPEDVEGSTQGWNESFDKLEEYLATL